MYQALTRPVNYGGLLLKNPILFSPTSLGLSQEETVEKLRRIAAGGCAMIIVGDVPVGRRGFGPSLFTKKGFAFYQALAQAVHGEDCRICAQLHQSDSNLKAMVKYLPGLLTKRISPQQLRSLLNQEVGPYITGLPEEKVAAITGSFGAAAQRAVEAGFDMVQIHGDRMCGSFASPLFNHRTDRYGGTVPNRARFALEAVAAVRRRLPGLPIDFKLAVRRENPAYGAAGFLEEELPAVVPLLEEAGVTSFHVTLANHSSLADTIPPANHPFFGGEGCFLGFCDQVKALTSRPVCGVGGLTSPDFLEEQLAAGRIDCAAMSRQLIADPDWPKKVLEGRPREIRRCVRCNRECLGGMMAHRGVHCIYERKDSK